MTQDRPVRKAIPADFNSYMDAYIKFATTENDSSREYTFTGDEVWNQQQQLSKFYSYSPDNGYFVKDAKLPLTNDDSVAIYTSIGSFNYSYNGLQDHEGGICIARDARIGISASLYNAKGTLEGVQLVYELANPLSIQLYETELVNAVTALGDSSH